MIYTLIITLRLGTFISSNTVGDFATQKQCKQALEDIRKEYVAYKIEGLCLEVKHG